LLGSWRRSLASAVTAVLVAYEEQALTRAEFNDLQRRLRAERNWLERIEGDLHAFLT
jgi:hypothetical protein